MPGIDHLIICNPYEMPARHWRYDRSRREFDLVNKRRPAGFLVATPDSKTFDDPGIFHELELVNRIRKRVDDWRQKGYPGITGVTKKLLECWHPNEQHKKRLFFCQLEAMETLIWLTEASESEKQGIDIPSDGGDFARQCCKMATGTGKTLVMAMTIAWQVLNKITYPHDARFSRNILIMAPGLTVKSRLKVLYPSDTDNIYEEFDLIPDSFYEKLFRANIIIHNWHTLIPEKDSPRSVVKLGTESNSAFAKRILEHDLDNIVVINDEAHHAYRADQAQTKNISKKDLERDKRWIEGLDKIHAARKIMHCFDFSATPFVPSGKSVTEDLLFKWIVSDFSLNDAIESGLTKTPRISIRDDSYKFSKDYRSRFYHLYMDDEVKSDLNRNAKPHEQLPDLVTNAYMLLGQHWTIKKRDWDEKGSCVPPVMITVCNKTSTAARVVHAFVKNQFELDELSDPQHLLRIDSDMIKKAEAQDSAGTSKEEELREKVRTVGKPGKLGGQIRNIVAVQMLSEGWDARNVTHIMGLRAFTSQLLCEQVIGRGLRRASYTVDKKTGLYEPEYVNVFGVPFTFLPHEGGNGSGPDLPMTIIEPDPDRTQHLLEWPNIDRIDADYKPNLTVDWERVTDLNLSSDKVSTTVGMAQVLAGKPRVSQMSKINLYELDKEIRLQRIVFIASKDVYEKISPNWKGNKNVLIAHLVRIVEKFIESEKINVIDIMDSDVLRKKMAIMFNMNKVVNHVWKWITSSSKTNEWITLNQTKQTKSTSDMRTWYTRKPTEHITKSHINLAPYDSGWELNTIHDFERNNSVISWVKNDHLGFTIKYLHQGIVRDYLPDFLAKLKNDIMLVLEIKGQDTERDKTKREYLKEWIAAVNRNGNYGAWACDVAFSPCEVKGIVAKHAKTNISAGRM